MKEKMLAIPHELKPLEMGIRKVMANKRRRMENVQGVQVGISYKYSMGIKSVKDLDGEMMILMVISIMIIVTYFDY